MQTRTGARSKLKGFITRNQNHSKAGKKLETKELENARGDNKTKLYKNSGGNLEHGKLETREKDKALTRGVTVRI